jgi:hypothetical protein
MLLGVMRDRLRVLLKRIAAALPRLELVRHYEEISRLLSSQCVVHDSRRRCA